MLKKWVKKEIKDSKLLGGTRTPGSGNKWNKPGDIKNSTYLMECKFTEKKSYSVSLKTLTKLYDEALFSFRIPVLSVQIQDQEVVVMFKEDFVKLIKNP